MAEYHPASRRPIADVFRSTAQAATRACLRLGVHPDAISYASIVSALAAALCFAKAGRWPVLLLVAPGFCYLRLWCNMLDGMVALASQQASRRGEIVNDLPDRISDVLIFVGVAESGLMHAAPGYWAAICALFTAYVGTLGQAVGGYREFGGWMAKPWRMVALHIGAWTLWAGLLSNRSTSFAGLSALDWTCLIIVAGCLQTIVIRLRRTLHRLR
jgi:phosphatidylglycerophosphate synthase